MWIYIYMDAYTYASTDTHGPYRELIPVTSQITICPCLLMGTGMSTLWTAVVGQDVFKDVVLRLGHTEPVFGLPSTARGKCHLRD